MDINKLKKFWSDPTVSKSFFYYPAEAWEGRDGADYIDYYWQYNYELQLCRSLGIDADNFISKFKMDELEENAEVTRDATE